MPTYEYACTACGHRFDIWQPVGSAAPECENCGQATKKVFQPPRVIFKGSGFYVTDLRSESSGGGKGSEKSSEAKESSGESRESTPAESKADAKPAESTTASTSSSDAAKSGGDKK